MIKSFWDSLSRSARFGFVAGVIIIITGTIALGVWLLASNNQVLFSNLAPQDASAMVAELDRMKIPYELGEGGTTILVDQDVVHKTRINLMGKDLPLHGAVGFELFNNADFGMTEFAQKINYQRAMQGEITRTILSLDEIQSARVHLAMAEDGLFKRAENKPKASITLAVKQGRSLSAEQVSGIQRLVSAAVPGVSTQEVTIVDQRGIALTRVSGADAESAGASTRLDLKKETEKYLTKKLTEILDRTFGAGEALGVVDVTLDMNQAKVTTEDVLGAPNTPGQAATGIIVREKEHLNDGGNTDAKVNGNARSTSQREVDYQVGRRVEQVVSTPGSVRKIQAVAVIKRVLTTAQQEQLQKSILTALGGAYERGDSVVIQNLLDNTVPATTEALVASGISKTLPRLVESGNTSHPAPPLNTQDFSLDMPINSQQLLVVIGVIFVSLLLIVFGNLLIKRPALPIRLSEAERKKTLIQINAWIKADATQTAGIE